MLPKKMKLSNHARLRLEERANSKNIYNLTNLMRSSVKWYEKDDLIHDCQYYRHCCYATRKSNQMGWITDGDIEIIYNKGTHVAITVLEVKDKFKPITQFIKPHVLEKIKIKRSELKMKMIMGKCTDCERTIEIISYGIYAGLCATCKQRKQNAKARNREYIAYKDLTEEMKKNIDNRRIIQQKNYEKRRQIQQRNEEPIILKVPDGENYYSNKANQTEITEHLMMSPINKKNSQNQIDMIQTLLNNGCEIPEEALQTILEVLSNTDKLKEIFSVIAKNDNQHILLDLKHTLNTVERKLQCDWELSGFQQEKDIEFKNFLLWRKTLKNSLLFWENLYQTDIITKIQKILDIDVKTEVLPTNTESNFVLFK